GERLGVGDQAHASAAPTRRCLDEDRVADAIGGGWQRRDALILAVIAGHDRNTRRLHQRLGRRFRAHQADGRGRRADENQAGIRAGLREIGVLGEKAVAGMDRVGARRLRRVDDGVDVKVAVLRRRRTDEHRLVGERDVHGIAIGVGINRHRAQSHAFGRAHDPARDLAAIGDQQFLETPGERHHHILLLTYIDFAGTFCPSGILPTALSQGPSASLPWLEKNEIPTASEIPALSGANLGRRVYYQKSPCILPKSEIIYSEIGGRLMTLAPRYPATRYDPSPLVDLSTKSERERLSPAAIKAFFNIMAKWGVRDEDARALLGGISNGQFYDMKKNPERTLDVDALTRISYLIGIFKALNILHSAKLADAWVQRANTNRIFGGQAPLAYMIKGGLPAMQTVRRLADARRGGM